MLRIYMQQTLKKRHVLLFDLNSININDFTNKIDLKVLDEAFLADSLEGRVYFRDEFD